MFNMPNSVADNSPVENLPRAVSVNDAWVYDRIPQTKAFQKPILWVIDPLAARPLSPLFDLVQFGDTERIAKGDHYLVVEKHTPEELVKACGWQLKASGINCKVYRVKTSLNYLLEENAGHLNYLLQENSGVSLQEITLLILDYSVSFSEWEATRETEQLTTRVAVDIARAAIAFLPEPQKSVELATLRKRCGESSYDWNKLMTSIEEEFRQELRKRKGQEVDELGINEPTKPQKIPPADVIAQRIAEDYKGKIAYNNEILRWLRYEPDYPGVWSTETDEFIESIVYHILTARGIQGYNSHSYITNIVKSLRNQLIERKWVEPSPDKLLPHRNGVLEVATGKLLPHSPSYHFTWSLPRDYNPTATDWSSIDSFLDHLSGNNPAMKDLLLCYCNAVLKGRHDLQKFLHLIGVGGTGKGTFARLLTSLIGKENVHTTTLDDWCSNRFEGANAYRKRLVLFPDEERQSGKLGKFLSLTGEDLIRAEEKNKKAFQYRYDGMVLVLSNLPIFTGDSASRVKRRIITVPCNNQVSIFKRCHKIEDRFESELPAFTNHVLSISDDRVTEVLLGLVEIPECTLEFWENRIRTDSIAAWLNDWVIYDPMAETAVGCNKDEMDSGDPITLYGSYAQHCRRSGVQAKAVKNFSPDLLELCRSVLGWEIEKKVTKTGKFIRGLRLRRALDYEIPTHDYLLLQRVTDEEQGGDESECLSNKGFTNGDDIALLCEKNAKARELETSLSLCDRRELEGTEESYKDGDVRAVELLVNLESPCGEDCKPSPLSSPDLMSEWMSEENLQAMTDDLESCDDIEMFRVMKSVYNKDALQVAAQRVSIDKQQILKQWMRSCEC